MKRYILIIPLLAALFLTLGCGGSQPPLSAEEADKFVADTPVITKAVKQAMLTLGVTDMRDAEKELTTIRQAKIVELGWDLDRHEYVSERFEMAVSCLWLGQMIENLEAGIRKSESSSQKAEYRAKIEECEITRASLRKRYDKITTVVERVFVDERLHILSKQVEGQIDTYQALR